MANGRFASKSTSGSEDCHEIVENVSLETNSGKVTEASTSEVAKPPDRTRPLH